jgi:hypothetical protein
MWERALIAQLDDWPRLPWRCAVNNEVFAGHTQPSRRSTADLLGKSNLRSSSEACAFGLGNVFASLQSQTI